LLLLLALCFLIGVLTGHLCFEHFDLEALFVPAACSGLCGAAYTTYRTCFLGRPLFDFGNPMMSKILPSDWKPPSSKELLRRCNSLPSITTAAAASATKPIIEGLSSLRRANSGYFLSNPDETGKLTDDGTATPPATIVHALPPQATSIEDMLERLCSIDKAMSNLDRPKLPPAGAVDVVEAQEAYHNLQRLLTRLQTYPNEP